MRALFPRLVLEAEGICVFGHGALNLIGRTVREISFDFDGHRYRRLWVARQLAYNLLGDLHQTHLGSRRLHVSGSNKRSRFR